MDQETLSQAMKLAGRPPSYERQPHDLGRFGLGLKTASLSQARSLTVATKQGQMLRAVRWDLDHLARTGRWSLQVLDDSEVHSLPWIESLDSHESGTLVLWEKLDQLHTAPELVEGQLDELMKRVRDHLGLVFHRFTGSTMPPLIKPLTVRIPRDELGKLARVQVNIPNTLDSLWALDIKKSSASPPPEVRRRLAQIADRIVGPSRRVHKYRGRHI